MLRSFRTLALTALASLGYIAIAIAGESKHNASEKQIVVDLGDAVKLKLTLIPSGEFMMGGGEPAEAAAAFFSKRYAFSPPFTTYALKPDFFAVEYPQHRVKITKPFYLGTYHVTLGQFRQFVKDTGYVSGSEKGEKINSRRFNLYGKPHVFEEETPGAKGWDPEKRELVFNAKYSWRNTGFEQTDEHAVVDVSWNDAVDFCKWLSRKEGKAFRLPTEAEWEYACRAGTTTRYSSGDDPEALAKVANVADATTKGKFLHGGTAINARDGYVFTSPVGSFKPNAFGLYDMHGNAWQWCADKGTIRQGYDLKSTANDPAGPDSGDQRIVRGGSWLDGPIAARSAARNWFTPVQRRAMIGFRIARNE